jgi:glycosidase
MKTNSSPEAYFSFEIQIKGMIWQKLGLSRVAEDLATRPAPPVIMFYRQLADRLNSCTSGESPPAKPGTLRLFALMNRIFRTLIDGYLDQQHPLLEDQVLAAGNLNFTAGPLSRVIRHFFELYPPFTLAGKQAATAANYLAGDNQRLSRRRRIVREALLLRLAMENPALAGFRTLFDDGQLADQAPYGEITSILDREFAKAPPCAPFHLPILELLRAPRKACPDSLAGQLEFIRANWAAILPPELLGEIMAAFDTVREEERERGDGPGPALVLEFTAGAGKIGPSPGEEYPEPERFSPDREWMPNVVLIAKMVYVWMDQLSRKYGRPINRLDEIPDTELDTLAAWGFTGLWLIGVWERSPASRTIKQYCGNPEAIASAYSLYDYVIAADLGGAPAMENLRHRASLRGIRLASDMVPNHTGIDSRWTREHPDWFIQVDYPPYPGYRFEGPDLSSTHDISLRIEDGYWSRTEAAVVFQHVDNRSGRVRYIYHGNDGTSTPWNDTAQLNYLLPEVREAVIQTILHVARTFPIIRFDAAMTLAKKHYQRLWFPQTGLGGGIPSRAEHALSRARFEELFPVEFWREVVDRVAAEAPDTLLLAEAFWLMEGYFVRTLGMHRVYNSAFMNMLKMEENAKYRQTIKNVLEFNPEILQRFVNFMNNPDERTAIDQFGKEGKYFGAAVLLVTMPGLPMFGHGQIEGFTEKYGMEYRRAYWAEEVDRHLVERHEQVIFPLMKKRHLFSGAEKFVLYDFLAGDALDENVFAYSNSCENERALIVFHNQFASTAGWIRTSSSRAAKDASGETRQVRTLLGEAFGFNPDGRYYYRFRDSATGLEYLRHGKELVEQGLFLQLEAYECHAFLDFREIRDDDFGTWGKLCRKLAGNPVASLDEELLHIQFSGTREALAELLPLLPKMLALFLDPAVPAPDRKTAGQSLQKKVTGFLFALQRESGLQLDIPPLTDGILNNLTCLTGIFGTKSRRKDLKEARETLLAALAPEKDYDNGTLYLLSLILRHLTESLAEGFHRSPERVLTEFALTRTLAAGFRKLADMQRDFQPGYFGGREELLLKILLRYNSFFLEQAEGEHGGGLMKQLFSDNDIREFLLVHLSGNIEWFNRERFEELMQTLFLTALGVLVERGYASVEVIRKCIRIRKQTEHYYKSAEESCYQTGLFLNMTNSINPTRQESTENLPTIDKN